MVEEKEEINTSVAGLNKLRYFHWITAIIVSAKGFRQHFCCCWTHVSFFSQVVVDLSWVHLGWIKAVLYLLPFFSSYASLGGFVFFFGFYLDHLVWPLVLGPLQLGRPHPPLFPWASAPPHCSQTWRSSSAEGERANGKSKKGGMLGMWAHSHVCQPTEPLALGLRSYHVDISHDELKQFNNCR